MTSFDYLWQMLDRHGVIERYKGECLMAKRQMRVVELMKTGMSRSEAWLQVKQEITR